MAKRKRTRPEDAEAEKQQDFEDDFISMEIETVEAPPQTRKYILRFRLTRAEFDMVGEAAHLDAAALAEACRERGLPAGMLPLLSSPSEWARYVVLEAAQRRKAAQMQKLHRMAEHDPDILGPPAGAEPVAAAKPKGRKPRK